MLWLRILISVSYFLGFGYYYTNVLLCIDSKLVRVTARPLSEDESIKEILGGLTFSEGAQKTTNSAKAWVLQLNFKQFYLEIEFY